MLAEPGTSAHLARAPDQKARVVSVTADRGSDTAVLLELKGGMGRA